MSMSQDILRELLVFLNFILLGIFILFVYDVLRIFRRIVSHNTIGLAAEDMVFWLLCSVLIFVTLYYENDGTIRYFAIAGVGAGMFFYNKTISPLLVEGVSGIIRYFLRLLFRVFRFLTAPFRFVLRKMKKFLCLIATFLLKRSKSFHKLLKKTGKTVKMVVTKK